MDNTSSTPAVEPEKMPESQESISIDGDNDMPIMDDMSKSLDMPLPQTCPKFKPIGTFQPLPTIDEAHMAHKDLNIILRPQQSSGIGYKDPGLDLMF